MNVTGRLGTYDVRWGVVGWTFAEVIVFSSHDEVTTVWKFFKKVIPKRRLWKTTLGRTMRAEEFEKMNPEPMLTIFQKAVAEYEDHKSAWDRHYEEMNPDINKLLEQFK